MKIQTFHNKKFFPPAFKVFFFLIDSSNVIKAVDWRVYFLFAGLILFAGGLTQGSLFHEAVRKSRNIAAGEVQFLG